MWVLGWLSFSILGAAILSRYNKAGTGFLLGLILGPLGLLFALIIRSGESKKEEQRRHEEQINALANLKAPEATAQTQPQRECPFCAETILAKAKVCKHCGRDVQPIAA
jgi:hypothetical protein